MYSCFNKNPVGASQALEMIKLAPYPFHLICRFSMPIMLMALIPASLGCEF